MSGEQFDFDRLRKIVEDRVRRSSFLRHFIMFCIGCSIISALWGGFGHFPFWDMSPYQNIPWPLALVFFVGFVVLIGRTARADRTTEREMYRARQRLERDALYTEVDDLFEKTKQVAVRPKRRARLGDDGEMVFVEEPLHNTARQDR